MRTGKRLDFDRRLKREVVPALPRIVYYVGLSIAITLLGMAVAAIYGWLP